jgi:hypothetical protein
MGYASLYCDARPRVTQEAVTRDLRSSVRYDGSGRGRTLPGARLAASAPYGRDGTKGTLQIIYGLLCAPHKLTAYESKKPPRRNLEASVRSRDTDDAKRSAGDLIEAGLN